MLRRVSAVLFEAPVNARIQVVVQSQNNNGVNGARFEYAGNILSREQILGLPGASFTVQNSRERLQAVVAFDGNAPGTARYDLLEVENGLTNQLGKFVLKSDQSSLIGFSIDPVPAAAVAAPAAFAAAGLTAAPPPPRPAPKKPAKPARKAKKPVRKAAKRTRKTAKKARGRVRKRR